MSAVAAPAGVFARIVCAVDERSESAAAATHAAALLDGDGTLEQRSARVAARCDCSVLVVRST